MILIFGAIGCSALSAQQDAPDPDRGHPEQLRDLAVLLDPGGTLRFDEALLAEYQPVSDVVPNLPPGSDSHWFRFRLPASSQRLLLEVDNPALDQVDLFVSAQQQWRHMKAGMTLPHTSRPLPTRTLVFPLSPADEPNMAFLRVAASYGGRVPLRLWSLAGFAGHVRVSQLVFGLFYGVMGVMTLYNLFLFVSLNDRSYLYYVLFVGQACLGWFILNGFAGQYLWPGAPSITLPVLLLLAGAGHLVGIRFTQLFLDTPRSVPRLHRALSVLMGLTALFLMLGLVVGRSISWSLITLISLPIVIVTLWSQGARMRQGYRPARYLFTASVALILGLTTFTLMTMGVLPAAVWTVYGGQIGWVVTSVLFSLGLADRIKLLREEKEYQQEQALAAGVRAERLAAADARKADELNAARELQHRLLPEMLPDLPFVEVAAWQRTATEVGGDYYDFLENPDSLLGVIGDATGHGASAGLVVACTKAAFLATAGDSPQQRIEHINGVLGELRLGSRNNMALVIFSLDPPAGDGMTTLRASGGGIPPIYVIRADGSVDELIPAGLPLGAVHSASYRTTQLDLYPGDCVVLVTDGLPERMDRTGQQLGYEPIVAHLRQQESGMSARALVDSLIRLSDRWGGAQAIADDETFIVLRVIHPA
ncbi:MAG TPA: 7TM diverse intracellular signaling domain-containing protein [Candidatus Latescibacteria bacterium]|nr:7TM diverse intracellular signaling domain-containing protein [Candidatus Latescibacterota bacterium]